MNSIRNITLVQLVPKKQFSRLQENFKEFFFLTGSILSGSESFLYDVKFSGSESFPLRQVNTITLRPDYDTLTTTSNDKENIFSRFSRNSEANAS